MKSISFYHELSAFLAGHKSVTRRAWKDSYAKTFKKGEVVAVYNKQRRVGGKRIGTIKLTKDPYKENTRNIPEEDWFKEGMYVLQGEGKLIDNLTPSQFWMRWKEEPEDLWVIRFKMVGN
ncbi:MAG TPA: hypothetical protein ENH62_01265 [Marinobacter sp.]|uniref:ASCH domain-containing protein n=1 Tax=marine sediment metagenome TaxID=412755 RepID=A0A0F9LN57_9ZZZZ|nr:hypothetical protein [Marinobacter sp.]